MHLNNATFLGMDRASLETLAFLDPGQLERPFFFLSKSFSHVFVRFFEKKKNFQIENFAVIKSVMYESYLCG
jgi:hypothetical protein